MNTNAFSGHWHCWHMKNLCPASTYGNGNRPKISAADLGVCALALTSASDEVSTARRELQMVSILRPGLAFGSELGLK